MLGVGGTSPNSPPYRRFGQSATSIPPDSCASRRLPRGPTSKAEATAKQPHLLVGCADIAPRDDFPSLLAGEGLGERGAARSAVPLTFGPRGSAEKRRSRGVWKRALSEQGHSPASSRASPRLRASQGTPRSGARTSGCVSLVTFFAQAKKATRPTGRNSVLKPAMQRDQAISAFIASATGSKPTAKSPLSRVWLNRTDIESVRSLGQTLSHEGRGHSARGLSGSAPHG